MKIKQIPFTCYFHSPLKKEYPKETWINKGLAFATANSIVHCKSNNVLPPFNISRNIDFQPGFLKIGWTKINFDNGFEFLRSFSWFAIVFVLALK